MTSGREHDRPPRDDRFVRDVLARTSGSPCVRAEQLLPDLVDDALPRLDRQLLQAHLEHCAGCRGLAVVLGWLGPQLTGLAELDPGPAFTQRVLSATTRRQRVALDLEAPATGLAGLMDRVGRWWERQILKPGFVTQAAYAATVVLVLMTTLPGAPLRGVPGRAIGLVAAGPASVPVVGDAADAVSAWVDRRTQSVRGTVSRQWGGYRSGLQVRSNRTNTPRAQLRARLGAFVDKAGDGDLGEAGYELLGALRAARSTWLAWWDDDDGTEDGQGT